MIVVGFMEKIIMVGVISVVQGVNENRGLYSYYKKQKDLKPPSDTPLESDLNKLSNDMWKSRNGFLVQKLWPAEVQGFEALGKK